MIMYNLLSYYCIYNINNSIKNYNFDNFKYKLDKKSKKKNQKFCNQSVSRNILNIPK